MKSYLEKIHNNEYIIHSSYNKGIIINSDGSNTKFITNEPFIYNSDIVNPVLSVIYDDGKKEKVGMEHINDIGIINFRDLGGYVNDEGRQVRYQTLYRSAVINPTEESLERFLELDIKTIIDLRSTWEVKAEPDGVFDNINYLHEPAMLEMENLKDLKQGLNMEELEKLMGVMDLKEYLLNSYKNSL